MKNRPASLLALCALSLSVATVHAQSTVACRDADLAVQNAKIVTMDANYWIATSMAIRNGHVLRVGTTKDVAPCIGRYTKVLDLHGQTVLPGLIDIHTHLTDWALRSFRNSIDASDPALHSIEDITKALALVIASKPKGTWIRG